MRKEVGKRRESENEKSRQKKANEIMEGTNVAN